MKPKVNRVKRYPTLRAWRGDRSQQEAGAALGMSQQQYSKIERGVLYVKGKAAKDLRAKTGVSLEVLVGAA